MALLILIWLHRTTNFERTVVLIGEISSIAAMSARKLVVVCGYDIYLCTKGKPQKIYEGGTMKPLIGCFGSKLFRELGATYIRFSC